MKDHTKFSILRSISHTIMGLGYISPFIKPLIYNISIPDPISGRTFVFSDSFPLLSSLDWLMLYFGDISSIQYRQRFSLVDFSLYFSLIFTPHTIALSSEFASSRLHKIKYILYLILGHLK